mgnify:CR=1 FL=1
MDQDCGVHMHAQQLLDASDCHGAGVDAGAGLKLGPLPVLPTVEMMRVSLCLQHRQKERGKAKRHLENGVGKRCKVVRKTQEQASELHSVGSGLRRVRILKNCIVFLIILLVDLNLVVDILIGFFDPRIEY